MRSASARAATEACGAARAAAARLVCASRSLRARFAARSLSFQGCTGVATARHRTRAPPLRVRSSFAFGGCLVSAQGTRAAPQAERPGADVPARGCRTPRSIRAHCEERSVAADLLRTHSRRIHAQSAGAVTTRGGYIWHPRQRARDTRWARTGRQRPARPQTAPLFASHREAGRHAQTERQERPDVKPEHGSQTAVRTNCSPRTPGTIFFYSSRGLTSCSQWAGQGGFG